MFKKLLLLSLMCLMSNSVFALDASQLKKEWMSVRNEALDAIKTKNSSKLMKASDRLAEFEEKLDNDGDKLAPAMNKNIRQNFDVLVRGVNESMNRAVGL